MCPKCAAATLIRTSCREERKHFSLVISFSNVSFCESKLWLRPNIDSSHPLEVFFNLLHVDHHWRCCTRSTRGLLHIFSRGNITYYKGGRKLQGNGFYTPYGMVFRFLMNQVTLRLGFSIKVQFFPLCNFDILLDRDPT